MKSPIQNCESRTAKAGFRPLTATFWSLMLSVMFWAGPSVAADLATPGTFISRGELGIAGAGTPELAFETMMWALINGQLDVYAYAFTPELRAEMLKMDRKTFSTRSKHDGPLFKGYEIVAEKKIGDDKVDLKLWLEDVQGRRTFPLGNGQSSDYGLQLMQKVENEWKVAGNLRAYETNWDDTNVVTYVK